MQLDPFQGISYISVLVHTNKMTHQKFHNIAAAGVVAVVKALAGALGCTLTADETALCAFKVSTT